MLIIGAGGFAKQLEEVIFQNKSLDEYVFYDDLNIGLIKLHDYHVLKNMQEAKEYFTKTNNQFTLGIGRPLVRYELFRRFEAIGGVIKSLISKDIRLAKYAQIGEGCNIMYGSVIENDVIIKKGVLINLNATICHDTIIEDFVELAPNVTITGRCKIGRFSYIGAGTVINPNITIGENVTIGSGSVVTKDIPDNCVVVGMPAKVIKQNIPLADFNINI